MSHRDHKQSFARARLAIACLAAALGLSPAVGRAATLPVIAPPPPLAAEQFGVNAGVLFNSGKYSPAQIDQQLAALARTGASVVRSDALWEYSEPQPPIGALHRYDWSFDDGIIGALAAHGLQWLPIIDYSATWAQSVPGQDHSPPALTGDYAAYAGALASRYGPGGAYWLEHPQLAPEPVQMYEIWNEPDNPVYWSPAPNPAVYADLYANASAAIIAAEPGARVVVGGLTRPAWFLSAMLAAEPGLRDQIAGVGIHPYGPTPGRVLANVRGARLAMRADGIGEVPLYVTEFGWTTERPGARDWAPAAVRPDYISQTFASLGHTDCNIAAVLLYAWATPERNPGNAQDWFGISPPGAGSTPDTAAFASGMRDAAASGPPNPVCSAAPVAAAANVLRHRSSRRRRARRDRTRAHRSRGRYARR